MFGTFLVSLTGKMRRFAWLLASGSGKKEAYSRIYSNRGNANTLAKNAHVLAKNPRVAAAIDEYRARLMPLADLRTEKIRVLQNLKAIVISHDVDDKTRLAACVKLYKFLDELIRAGEATSPASRSLRADNLIDELLAPQKARASAKRVPLSFDAAG